MEEDEEGDQKDEDREGEMDARGRVGGTGICPLNDDIMDTSSPGSGIAAEDAAAAGTAAAATAVVVHTPARPVETSPFAGLANQG